MFEFIRKMFGEGKIRTEIVCDDGSTGVVKVSYTGDLATLDHDELKQHVKNWCLVEHGLRVVSVKITGAY